MKFTCSVTIDLPRKRVIELFDSVENLKEWQDGFYSFQPLEGEEGKNGSTAAITYFMGKEKRKMVITETIIDNSLPDYFLGSYVSPHTVNTMKNVFTDLGGQTRYDAEIHYSQFKGFIIKIIARFKPDMFQKQVQKWLNQFKEFAEREGE